MKKNKMVLVEWLDSNVIHGWRLDNNLDFDEVAHCRVIGILKIQNETKIVLVMGDSDCGSVFETIAIPKECIIKIKELRIK